MAEVHWKNNFYYANDPHRHVWIVGYLTSNKVEDLIKDCKFRENSEFHQVNKKSSTGYPEFTLVEGYVKWTLIDKEKQVHNYMENFIEWMKETDMANHIIHGIKYDEAKRYLVTSNKLFNWEMK